MLDCRDFMYSEIYNIIINNILIFVNIVILISGKIIIQIRWNVFCCSLYRQIHVWVWIKEEHDRTREIL